VIEFGLVGATMHQTDEHVEVEHVRQLKAVYARILADYFAAGGLA
jgi:succinyl-diaminopimelate desuccinylase